MEEVYKPFPQEPLKQLEEAIEAVFKSWDNDSIASSNCFKGS
jgi:pyruvate,orthophosphate dikinase